MHPKKLVRGTSGCGFACCLLCSAKRRPWRLGVSLPKTVHLMSASAMYIIVSELSTAGEAAQAVPGVEASLVCASSTKKAVSCAVWTSSFGAVGLWVGVVGDG